MNHWSCSWQSVGLGRGCNVLRCVRLRGSGFHASLRHARYEAFCFRPVGMHSIGGHCVMMGFPAGRCRCWHEFRSTALGSQGWQGCGTWSPHKTRSLLQSCLVATMLLKNISEERWGCCRSQKGGRVQKPRLGVVLSELRIGAMWPLQLGVVLGAFWVGSAFCLLVSWPSR
jgi:hypothetical protein